MPRKKFYAVKSGYATGVFETWPECVAAVARYPKPLFSAFYSKEEALAWMARDDVVYKQEKKNFPAKITD